jgi:hypothetical protein
MKVPPHTAPLQTLVVTIRLIFFYLLQTYLWSILFSVWQGCAIKMFTCAALWLACAVLLFAAKQRSPPVRVLWLLWSAWPDLASFRTILSCDLKLVEIKCINFHHNTTVFSNCWRNQLHVSALFWMGHHQVETRISEKAHIIQCGHQEWGNEISFYNVWGDA